MTEKHDTMRAVAPVGNVYTMEALVPGGSVKYHVQLNRQLPAGTPLYAADQLATARADGYRAGLERAANVLPDPGEVSRDRDYWHAISDCEDAIRAEIGKEEA